MTTPTLTRLQSLMTGDEKHSAASTSTLDVIWVLYDRVLNVSPATVDDPDRDRFLLSKGHGPVSFYAVLAAKGFLDGIDPAGIGAFDSPLGFHPDRSLIPGVEIASGSLGHGLGIGVGVALGLRAQGRLTPRTWVLLGDAELDEGSNHEAIPYAGATGLDSLAVVVIDNQSSTYGWPGGIASRFAVNGWATETVDGRDHEALYRAFTAPHPGRPYAVVATVEAKDSADA
ncbi:MAG TPA: transketolase [Micromonosporaceae bacterium]|jgi:transketolase